jgi:hypothetical protein
MRGKTPESLDLVLRNYDLHISLDIGFHGPGLQGSLDQSLVTLLSHSYLILVPVLIRQVPTAHYGFSLKFWHRPFNDRPLSLSFGIPRALMAGYDNLL